MVENFVYCNVLVFDFCMLDGFDLIGWNLIWDLFTLWIKEFIGMGKEKSTILVICT